MRINVARTTLLPGEGVELVAEGRGGAEQPWIEVKALWHSYPEQLGILEVPPSQDEGMSRTFFTAKGPGRVTVIAQLPALADIKGRVTLEIAGQPTPLPKAPPTATVAVPGQLRPLATRTPRPTPAVTDSPQLRQAITRLDQLDRQVLGVVDSYMGAFRAFGSKEITIDQLRETVDYASPRMDAAIDELKRFQPPVELKSVYDRYVMVATRLRQGLAELSEYSRTSDAKHAAAYVQLTADALVMSVQGKADLDSIAIAIGMPVPRSTRIPLPTRTP